MNLLIGGDLVPTNTNIDLFNSSNLKELLGEDLLELWSKSQLKLFNLEVPLADEKNSIAKCGPNLIAPTSSISGIKSLDPTLIVLANNHILDQGIQGLKSTEEILKNNNIPFVGIGENLTLASKAYVIEKEGYKIGVYSCTEHEYSIATNESAGANPFDPLESFDHITALKEKTDYVIILYHGGKEHYRYPTPYLQRVCRKMVQKGADLVVCQHSHSIGCFEQYNASTIVYGQGNFIFDKLDNEHWRTSLLINIIFKPNLQIEYIPIIKKRNVVRLAPNQEASEILESFQRRSNEINQKGFIEKKYQEFASESSQSYLRAFAGGGKWASRIDRKIFKGHFLKKRFSKSQLLAIQNYIECEAHRELVLHGLKEKLKRIEK